MSYQFHHRVTVRNCVLIYRWVLSLPKLILIYIRHRGQMNSTAILWRIFFYRLPLARRVQNRILQGWMIPQYCTLKSKLLKYCLKKCSTPQYRKPPCPPPCYVTTLACQWISPSQSYVRSTDSLYSNKVEYKYHQLTWYYSLWLWSRLPHSLSKHQSLSTTTVLFRTTFTRTIKLNLL